MKRSARGGEERRRRQDRAADTETASGRAQEGRRRQEQGRRLHRRAAGLAAGRPDAGGGGVREFRRPVRRCIPRDGPAVRRRLRTGRLVGGAAVRLSDGAVAAAGGPVRVADGVPADRAGLHPREDDAQAGSSEPRRGAEADVQHRQPVRGGEVASEDGLAAGAGGTDPVRPVRSHPAPAGGAAGRGAGRVRRGGLSPAGLDPGGVRLCRHPGFGLSALQLHETAADESSRHPSGSQGHGGRSHGQGAAPRTGPGVGPVQRRRVRARSRRPGGQSDPHRRVPGL